jgi:hypothetical protein
MCSFGKTLGCTPQAHTQRLIAKACCIIESMQLNLFKPRGVTPAANLGIVETKAPVRVLVA